MGFDSCFAVSGQTYSRKLDYQMLTVLCGIAMSATKFSNDIRLLQHMERDRRAVREASDRLIGDGI